MAEEKGLQVDIKGFEAAMVEAKERSRGAQKKSGGGGVKFEAEATGHLAKEGVSVTIDSHKYEERDVLSTVEAILQPDGFVKESSGSGEVGIVLKETSFYAEQGGQVADTGILKTSNGAELAVSDCRVAAGYVIHIGKVT